MGNEQSSFKKKVILLTLLIAVPAFLTGKMIWPPNPMEPVPSSTQLPFFIILAALEAILFGLGVSFIIFGYPIMKKMSGKRDTLTLLAFAAVAWNLVSWWPHDNMHIHNGMDLQGLLYIEYGFHFTLMLSGIILATFFLRQLKKG